MNKSSRNVTNAMHKHRADQHYGELIDMIESGMEDYEIADELGTTQGYVSDIKKQIYNDMI